MLFSFSSKFYVEFYGYSYTYYVTSIEASYGSPVRIWLLFLRAFFLFVYRLSIFNCFCTGLSWLPSLSVYLDINSDFWKRESAKALVLVATLDWWLRLTLAYCDNLSINIISDEDKSIFLFRLSRIVSRFIFITGFLFLRRKPSLQSLRRSSSIPIAGSYSS